MFLTTEIVKEWENCTLFKSKSWINACGLMEWWLPFRAILSNIISWSKISISNDMLSCILGKMWFAYIYGAYRASSMGQWVKKNLSAMQKTQETWLWSWVGKIPWRRKWQPTPVFLPEKSYGQRSLAGYSPLCHKELDTTEWLSTHAWSQQGT